VTREAVGERLARVVCADRDALDDGAIDGIADAVAAAQVQRTAAAINRVRERHPTVTTAVVTGIGDFIAAAAAAQSGLAVHRLADVWGPDAAHAAPATAVALLRAQLLEQPAAAHGMDRPRTSIDIVIKVGGALLARPAAFEAVVANLSQLGPTLADRAVLVVPGGGPFADSVRAVDAEFGLGDDASHWMAILAMDQYAHLLAARVRRSVLVDDPSAARAVCGTGRIPVLAPYRRLRNADPLPHSWDVTSDSIALWLALDAGASELILVKPVPGPADALTDAHFSRLIRQAAALGRRLVVHCCVGTELWAVAGVGLLAAAGPPASESPAVRPLERSGGPSL
jgi:aspartokinase-like uncharacterized kinase